MCSVIGTLDGEHSLMGASYDFYYGHGQVFVNKRGLHKIGLAKQAPYHEWECLYGSVTINQFGRELPTCGMNEYGLSIHLLEQKGGGDMAVDDRPSVNEIQWIQYQLDCFKNIDEVISSLDNLAIVSSFFSLHYALCDAFGKVVFIDFVDGKTLVNRATSHNPTVLTNHTYQESLLHFDQMKNKPIPKDQSSLSRFVRLANMSRNDLIDENLKDFLFRALSSVYRKPNFMSLLRWLFFKKPPVTSFWNSVFEPGMMRFYWRTSEHQEIRYLDLLKLNFDPEEPVMTLDVNAKIEGCANTYLQMAKRSDNQKIIEKSYQPLGKQVSLEEITLLIDYPESFQKTVQVRS